MVKEEVQFVTRRLALIDSSLRELMSKPGYAPPE